MDIFNSELFVNLDPTLPVPLTRTTINNEYLYPEFLFLVNGLDDNVDGFVDNGFDGIDNDGDGYARRRNPEWVEIELAALGSTRQSEKHSLHHHPPAGGVAGLPRDAAAIERGG